MTLAQEIWETNAAVDELVEPPSRLAVTWAERLGDLELRSCVNGTLFLRCSADEVKLFLGQLRK